MLRVYVCTCNKRTNNIKLSFLERFKKYNYGKERRKEGSALRFSFPYYILFLLFLFYFYIIVFKVYCISNYMFCHLFFIYVTIQFRKIICIFVFYFLRLLALFNRHVTRSIMFGHNMILQQSGYSRSVRTMWAGIERLHLTEVIHVPFQASPVAVSFVALDAAKFFSAVYPNVTWQSFAECSPFDWNTIRASCKRKMSSKQIW